MNSRRRSDKAVESLARKGLDMPDESNSAWEVRVTETAARMLRDITDARIRRKILDVITDLKDQPEVKGKPLIGELARFRSIRAVGQRYRILYQLEGTQVVVYVVAIGIRKEGDKRDIYKLAQRLMRLGLLDAESTQPGK
jgi:mRNA interferase RelE/StbE